MPENVGKVKRPAGGAGVENQELIRADEGRQFPRHAFVGQGLGADHYRVHPLQGLGEARCDPLKDRFAANRSSRRQSLVFLQPFQVAMEFGEVEQVDSFALQRQVGRRRFTPVAGAQNGNLVDHGKIPLKGPCQRSEL